MPRHAVRLPDDLAKAIAGGELEQIPVPAGSGLGRQALLVGNEILGVVETDEPTTVEARELESHGVTHAMRRKHWPRARHFDVHDVVSVSLLDEPRSWEGDEFGVVTVESEATTVEMSDEQAEAIRRLKADLPAIANFLPRLVEQAERYAPPGTAGLREADLGDSIQQVERFELDPDPDPLPIPARIERAVDALATAPIDGAERVALSLRLMSESMDAAMAFEVGKVVPGFPSPRHPSPTCPYCGGRLPRPRPDTCPHCGRSLVWGADVPERGLNVSPPRLATSIARGDTTLIVKPQRVDLEAGRYVLVTRRSALAVVSVGSPRKLGDGEFEEREADHGLDSEILSALAARNDDWKDPDELWAWDVEVERAFSEPLETDAPRNAGVVIPSVTVETEKIDVDRITPDRLSDVGDQELLSLNHRLHQFWGANFEGNDSTSAGDLNREDLVNAYIFVADEMRRRGMSPDPGTDLGNAAQRLSKATTRAGADSPDLPTIRRDDFLSELETFKVRMPFLYLVGGLANRGESQNDIDVLVKGPVSDELLRVVEFRLGRMLPPELSKRLSVLQDEHGGPFTNHVELADLVVEMRKRFDVKEMRLEKADDPLMDRAEPGPNPAVFQYHSRGKSLHGDLRMKVGDHLVGWTVSNQRPGKMPDVETVEELRRIAEGFDLEGDRYTKPWIAPSHLLAHPKSRQPLEWLEVDGKVFEPGEVGATRNERGVMVVADSPRFEQGIQKPYFHEYFFTGDVMEGILYFRQLSRKAEYDDEGGSEEKPAGTTFWVSHFSKEHLPTVLKRRSVREKTMPPDGCSAMPKGLRDATPKEFRFWEAKGAEARQIRDALVESGHFDEDNVAVVDGEFTRTVKKTYLWVPGDDEPILKRERAFTLSVQRWKGPSAVRAEASRKVYHLFVESNDGLDSWELQHDPLSGEEAVTAIHRNRSSKDLLRFEGDVEPGQEIGGSVMNETKATPSRIEILDAGRVDVDRDGGLFLRFAGERLRGPFTLVPEEEGSSIWVLERGEEKRRDDPWDDALLLEDESLIKEVGPQVWDPERKEEGRDRSDLEPPALFQPMKPRLKHDSVEEVTEEWATEAKLRDGLRVEPKWNGFRFVVQKSEGRVTSFTEDMQRDYLGNLPELREALEKIPGSWIIDAEFMATNEGGGVVPRRDLAAYRSDEPPRGEVKIRAFDLLYLDGDALVDRPLDERAKNLGDLLGDAKKIEATPCRIARTESELRKHVSWASGVEGSEGAMIKLNSSTYTLGGETSSWGKLKTVREIRAIVSNRNEVEGSPGVYNFECCVSVDNKDEWEDVVEIGGNLYTPIGRTFNAKLDAKRGDVLRVEVTELLFDEKGKTRNVTWFTPTVIDETNDEPMSAGDVRELALPGEVEKFFDGILEKQLPFLKAEGDERFVYGIVLEPEVVDSQNDIYSAEEIRAAAHLFMEKYRNVGLMHRAMVNDKVRILESFVAPADFGVGEQSVKRGTWLMAVRVLDDDLWAAVKSKKLDAFSIGGTAISTPES